MAVAVYPTFILLVTVLLISCLRGTVALVNSKLTINFSEAACRWHAYTHALSLAILIVSAAWYSEDIWS